MNNNKRFLTTVLALSILGSSIAGCGGRLNQAANLVNQVNQTTSPVTGVTPSTIDTTSPVNTTPYYPAPTMNYGQTQPMVNTVPTGAPNPQLSTIKVDQDLLNQWQARGIAAVGGTLYVAATDTGGIFKKGTVLKIGSNGEKSSWKDLASSLLGLSHPMNSTIKSIAVSGSDCLVLGQDYLYKVTGEGKVQKMKFSGGTDITVGGGAVYISSGGTVMKTDNSVSSKLPVAGVSASGPIAADNSGNLFFVSGSSIKMVNVNNTMGMNTNYNTGYNTDSLYSSGSTYTGYNANGYRIYSDNYYGAGSGMAQDIVMGLTSPIDLAIDNRNGDLYVLESGSIRRFDRSGNAISQFPHGASKPEGIAIDESGNVYVADSGSSYKDSKIIKFGPAPDVNYSTSNSYNNYGNIGYSGYNSYPNQINNGYNGYNSYSTPPRRYY